MKKKVATNRKNKRTGVVPTEVLEFHDHLLTPEQIAITLKNMGIQSEIELEAMLANRGGSFKNSIDQKMKMAEAWEADTSSPKGVPQLAHQFRELTRVSIENAQDQRLIDAMEAGFIMGAQWEHLNFQTGALAEAIRQHWNGRDGQINSAKSRKDRRQKKWERAKEKMRELIRNARTERERSKKEILDHLLAGFWDTSEEENREDVEPVILGERRYGKLFDEVKDEDEFR